jgi:5-oxoprolinase (ATP-hydrolysing)
MAAAGWRFWIDRGGTFTDLVARAPDGALQVGKVLSVQPGVPGDPAVRAIRELIGLPPPAPIPAGLIAEVRLGTTVATNAVLERQGRPTLLLLNRGFADLLSIGDQHRPDLFALEIHRPLPLAARVLEVGGRLAVDGTELEPLQCDGSLAEQLRQARAEGIRCVAVALLHAYRHPRHERALGSWLETFGFEQIALSHQVSPLPRLVPRAHTTVLEASVGPVLSGYLAQVQDALGPEVPLRVMQSSGGLIAPQQLRAKDTILSGPAGGLVGASRIGASLGFRQLVGFDMGGTSTDVSWSDGSGPLWQRREQSELHGLPLQAPMLDIHTVAAGGGSLIRFDGLRLQVGPASAGADPGPACYGRGGPLTVTDANLLLGRLQAAHLPAVFGPGGDQPADPAPLRPAFAALAQALGCQGACAPEQAAEGALAIAVERMAEAIRRISIQQGRDVRRAVLCSFGGAGGQHACAVAEALGIEQVLLHPLAGVLSAYGIGLADEVQLIERSLREPLTDALLRDQLHWASALPGAAPTAAAGSQRRCTLHLRTAGSDTCLPIPWDGGMEMHDLQAAFVAEHRRRFGYAPELGPAAPVVLERFSVEVLQSGEPLVGALCGASSGAAPLRPSSSAAPALSPLQRVPVYLRGTWQDLPLWQRESLAPGARLEGPALVVASTGTTLLLPGWNGQVLADGSLLLGHEVPPPCSQPGSGQRLDALSLELFSNRFTAIAEQMGTRLQQTSSSVNIKERLDFSCALFDRSGALVVNAPHIPVHLGSMGESVVALLAAVARGERRPLAPGDAVVSNNPYNGGTHLPDLTVITPVFAGEDLVAFVASRGHHADVGGITPGSMPPHSRSIEEEGLLLDNAPLLEHGCFEEALWRKRLSAGRWPVRNPDQLLADLRAQLAANQLGVQRLEALIATEGLPRVQAAMAQVQQQAAEAVRRVIDRLVDGAALVELDGGERIAVTVTVDRPARRVRLDFSGTSGQQQGNLNAPLAITKAVVLYVFRCLVDEPIPLNAGCFEPLELVVPRGCLLHPEPPAAVVAGNVETSQAVANALLAALGVMAAAQGTMNNLSFGNADCQYYETICGGTGAGRRVDGSGFPGAAAVQSHMTNSRLTDPELLEERLPVRLVRFGVRRGSGGAGRWPGGDGVIRELCALEPLTLSLLSGSRRIPPFGLAGGGPGACGVNTLIRRDGSVQTLPGSIAVDLAPGDRVCVATPGGGGYGHPHPDPDAHQPAVS